MTMDSTSSSIVCEQQGHHWQVMPHGKICLRCGYGWGSLGGSDVFEMKGGPFILGPEGDDKIDPAHYRQHPSGIECIQITEHMSFTLGNVVKYVWRADLKNGIDDLKKARWYLDREIAKRGG